MFFNVGLREDKHKKCFFSGRTTKRWRGGKTPLTTKQKTTFFIKGENLRKKYEPLRSRVGGGYPVLSGSTTKKPVCFLCASSLRGYANLINILGGPSPPKICGVNTGQHMYIDASDQCNNINIDIDTGSSTTRNWNIKVGGRCGFS